MTPVAVSGVSNIGFRGWHGPQPFAPAYRLPMIQDAHLQYMAALLGDRFLAYVSGTGVEDVQARLHGRSDQLDDPAEAALLAVLQQAGAWVPIVPAVQPPLVPDGNRPDGSPEERMRRFAWVDMDVEQSWANLARLGTG